ncbi:hypothetical protein Tco_0268552 [Tanacetum coccineum]
MLFEIRAPLVHEFLLEFFSTCRIGDEMGLDVAGTLCFQLGGSRRIDYASRYWRKLESRLPGVTDIDVRSLRGLVERSITDQGIFSTWMIGCMTQLIDASGQTYQAFDGTFWGSSPDDFDLFVNDRSKTGSKFSTIVHEYVTKPSGLSKSRAELKRKCLQECGS